MSDTEEQGRHGEPWHINIAHDTIAIIDADGKSVMTLKKLRAPANYVETWEHIVACVNGCVGIDPKAAKDLLAMCKELKTALDGAIRTAVYNQDAFFAEQSRIGIKGGIIKRAHAAIAKAEGEEPQDE